MLKKCFFAVAASFALFLLPLCIREISLSDSLYDSVVSDSLGGLPVLKGGRVMPISSAAEDFARMVGGRDSAKFDGERVSAAKLLWTLCSRSDFAGNQRIFRTDNKELQALLGAKGRYFSFADVERCEDSLRKSAEGEGKYALACREVLNSAYLYAIYSESLAFSFSKSETARESVRKWRKAVEEAASELESASKNSREPKTENLIPASRMLKTLRFVANAEASASDKLLRNVPRDGSFLTPVEAMLDRSLPEESFSALSKYSELRDSLSKGDLDAARKAMSELYSMLRSDKNIDFARLKIEQIANAVSPFSGGLLLYAAALFCFGLSSGFQRLREVAFYFALVFLIGGVCSQSLGILARMYIQMRPPVTNLYSSIVFAGACGALVGLLMCLKRRVGIYGVSAATAGFLSLIIAVNMPSGEDSMGVMRAVLNSNFWLTAHVVTIMVGYCGIFLGGTVSAFRLLANLKSRENFGILTGESARGVYSIECFAMLFIFAGTMLGGIWADMSWGRFWGWDPKENGALMTLLWCAFCIHGRTFKIFSDRVFLAFCVFGNVVAAWAWFGVNMLGVGLHSYGFFEGGWFWFSIFSILHVLIMPLCLLKYSAGDSGKTSA